MRISLSSYTMLNSSIMLESRGEFKMRESFLSIGEFGEISRCSAFSLRYYERIGALLPAYVDERTGYRYYNPQQAYQARLIKLGIDVGMSPKTIGRYFYETDVYDMDDVMATFEDLAAQNMRNAYVEQLRVQAQRVELQRQRRVDPLGPRAIQSGKITHFRLYCADALEDVPYRLYVRKLRECLARARALDIPNLAQEGLTQSEEDGKWYVYIDVLDEDGIDDKVAGSSDLQIHRYDRDRFVTQSVQGATLESCFENVFGAFDVDEITCLTELWAFTMQTGIAALEVTLKREDA